MWDTGGLRSSLRLMASQLKYEIIIIIIIIDYQLRGMLMQEYRGECSVNRVVAQVG